MKKYLVFISIATLGFLSSCDEYVDLDPKGQVIPREVEDLRLIMQNDLELSKAGSAPIYMEDNLVIPEAKQQAIATSPILYGASQTYDFADVIYPEGGEIPDQDWFAYYETIGIANYVDNQMALVDGRESEKNEILADAKVHRAYNYFKAVNQYARHYGLGDPNEPNSGVPIVTVFGDVEVSLERASIQEVYDFIISDLEFAIENHPNAMPQFIFQGSKWSANGLLANVYLHMGDYQKAVNYATDALSINDNLINYPTELAALEGSLGDPSRNPNAAVGVMMHKTATVPYEIGFVFVPRFMLVSKKQLYLAQDLVDLFDQANDMRYTGLTELDFASGLRRYKGGDAGLLSANFGFTTSELLLIRAEANARLGNTQAAIDDINYLRANRINSTDPNIVNLTATSAQEAVQHALDEKRRETMFKGVRYFDIKRLNAVENANISLTRETFDGNMITIDPNEIRWIMPIGGDELVLNPEIGQRSL